MLQSGGACHGRVPKAPTGGGGVVLAGRRVGCRMCRASERVMPSRHVAMQSLSECPLTFIGCSSGRLQVGRRPIQNREVKEIAIAVGKVSAWLDEQALGEKP